jgi:hypothetical protein
MSHRATEPFFILPRSLTNDAHPLWAVRHKHPEWIVAYIDMCSLAAFKDHSYERCGVEVPLRRGEFVMSQSLMAKRFDMTNNEARYFLTFLHTRTHILEKGRITPLGTVYRIVNYGAEGGLSQTFHTRAANRVTRSFTPETTPERRTVGEGKRRIDLSSSFLGAKSKAVASEALEAKPERVARNGPPPPTAAGTNGGLKRGLERLAHQYRMAGTSEEEIEQIIARRRKAMTRGGAV